jgi:hypothetical protein
VLFGRGIFIYSYVTSVCLLLYVGSVCLHLHETSMQLYIQLIFASGEMLGVGGLDNYYLLIHLILSLVEVLSCLLRGLGASLQYL